MKRKFLVLHVPLVILFALAFTVGELGSDGKLNSAFLRSDIFPPVKRLQNLLTDIKFKIRGPQAPKNKILIATIDSESIQVHGRWPWHRDVVAALINSLGMYGAKAIGIDIVFSEADPRVPDELREMLKKKKMGSEADKVETDPVLMRSIIQNIDTTVLGWVAEQTCQPAYEGADCLKDLETGKELIPGGYEKFAFNHILPNSKVDVARSPLLWVISPLVNIPKYNDVGLHAGNFQVVPDPDGYNRRIPLAVRMGDSFYPTLGLAVARAGLKDSLTLELDVQGRIKQIGFDHGRKIDVTPLGVMEINFRGPGGSFQYISIKDILDGNDKFENTIYPQLNGRSKKEIFKDAYVLIGPTAIGIYDMRAFPFDTNVAGVEGHATILDNILAGDWMLPSSKTNGAVWMLLLIVVGALAFAYGCEKFEAVPALLLFLGFSGVVVFIDIKLLFAKNINWNTSLFYLELVLLFGLTSAWKYVEEERNKKFIRGAFSKYVAPAVVDAILLDPTKLSVGGEKKDLTILFSDIRSFTTFSEQMDAKMLASFLNEYLGIMTDIVFDHHGTLDKYIGDAIMAFWGAPLDQPTHALNACNAAIAMKKALGENKKKWLQKYGINVNIGIGVNSGVVNVGNMGCERSFEYTVIGDHVNLASRLEGLTKEYGTTIATTRFTFDDIHKTGNKHPAHRILDSVKVKGKKNAIELIELLEIPPDPEGLKLFDEGRKLYREQKWSEAIKKFQAASNLISGSAEKNDGPCDLFAERCEFLGKNPPGPAWDGIWEMEHK
ncbi:MAG: adenylate/guanylate cyclase domain-containing protein [Bdellovibrionota bacterium]